MPFGLVSAWNKHRRSKSQDHTDPCMFFTSFPTVSASPQHSYITFMSSTFQGFINLWSFRNLKIKPPNTPKGTMDQFSHSGRDGNGAGPKDGVFVPAPHDFVLPHPRPALHDGKIFLTPSPPLGAPQSLAPPRKNLLFVNLPYN